MYFSTSQSGNRKLADLVAEPARQFGAHLVDEEFAHIPFESVVAAIAGKSRMVPELAARELVGHESDYRAKAFRVGVEEVMRSFGGEDKAMRFYRQAASEGPSLRFESTGGVKDDVASVRNRLAASAANAYWAREKDESRGLIVPEREYVDLLKSVRQALETAVSAGKVSPDVAEQVVADLEAASVNTGLFGMKEMIRPLQDLAREELYDEQVRRVMERYTGGLNADDPAPGH
ncbi:hypothetical protein R70006_04952 [Paraburkholderia domus]|uniref:hypothetical protein n=1 Tax=Paraburkholderia domus TaxID=2793075 RepID=UPI0019114A4C|nr:hypothetical protein [Paraburkholderia domus]MBK5051812.1 hypothetical protein [Burkholderia sp. R-70006]CAE6793343.1 hypothetical protein R70006_04952 [Paraburkholderia domus]